MNYKQILRAMMRRLNLKQDGLAAYLGVSQATVSRWLNDRQKPELEADAIIREKARQLGILESAELSVNDVEECQEEDQNTAFLTVEVVGYVGAGSEAHFYGEGQGPFGETDMPPVGRSGLFAVVVRGDSMSPTVEDGSTIYYESRREPPTPDMVGRLCVIGLEDGRVLVKKLRQGRTKDRWDLYSPNAPVILDQVVVWAAKAVFIKLP